MNAAGRKKGCTEVDPVQWCRLSGAEECPNLKMADPPEIVGEDVRLIATGGVLGGAKG